MTLQTTTVHANRPFYEVSKLAASETAGGRVVVDDVTYTVANRPDLRGAAFELIYRAYVRAGLMEENNFRKRVTPYHMLDTSTVFVAIVDDVVIATCTLIGDGDLGIPMESIYKEEILDLREQGQYVGEVSCLADRRQEFLRSFPIFVHLNRLMAQYARHHGLDQLLITVHPRHERFYHRLMGFQQIGGLKSYPMVCGNPAVAASLDFQYVDRNPPRSYEQFFGNPIPANCMIPSPLTAQELLEYEAVAELCDNYLPLAAC